MPTSVSPPSLFSRKKKRLPTVQGESGRAPNGTAIKPTISKGASAPPAKTVGRGARCWKKRDGKKKPKKNRHFKVNNNKALFTPFLAAFFHIASLEGKVLYHE